MKKVLKDFFDVENKRYQSMLEMDSKGLRLCQGLRSEILKTKKKISNVKEPNKILEILAVDFENFELKMLEINEEVNASRREQLSRVNTIKDCFNLIIDFEKNQEVLKKKKEKEKASEEQRVNKIVEKLASGEDPEKDIRTIGQRPEKIRDVKLAKAKFDKSKNIT